jgi:hypothetical protein
MATTTMTDSVIGIFKDMKAAEKAIKDLGARGVPASAISLVTQNLTVEGEVQGFVTTRDLADETAKIGAWTGGIFGLLTGAALILTPAGPMLVAGGLAAPLLGALEGAGVGYGLGALSGAIFGRLVAKHHIPKIETHLSDGEYLVVVQGDPEIVGVAREVLKADGAEISDHEAP